MATKSESIRVYSMLVKTGQYYEASRLLRALNNGVKYIRISLSDVDWNLAEALGFPGATDIKIQ